MGQNNLDHYIKSTLSDHPTMINTDEIWSGIQYKKKNRAYRFIAIFSLICISLLSVFLVRQSAIDKKSNEQALNYSSDDNVNNILTSNKQLINASESNIINNNLFDSSGNLENNKNVETAATNKLEFSDNKTIDFDLKLNNSSNLNKDKSPIETTKYYNKEASTTKKYNPSNIELKKESLYHQKGESVKKQLLIKPLMKSKIINKFDILHTPLKELDVKHDALLMLIASTDCPTFESKKNRIFGEVYSTLDYITRSYNSSIESQEYLSERTSSQSYRPSFRAGAQFKYLFNNGIFVKSGIEYGVARERFSFRKETITTEIKPNQVINIHIDTNGDTTRTLGNAEVTIIETKNWKVKNSYKSFGIPLSVGYHIHTGPWFYALEAGIIYNLSFTFKGMILDQSMTPIEAGTYFKDKIGINYTFGLTAGYHIHPQLNFIIKANLRSINNNINSDINIIDEKYTMIGTGIGLEYQF